MSRKRREEDINPSSEDEALEEQERIEESGEQIVEE